MAWRKVEKVGQGTALGDYFSVIGRRAKNTRIGVPQSLTDGFQSAAVYINENSLVIEPTNDPNEWKLNRIGGEGAATRYLSCPCHHIPRGRYPVKQFNVNGKVLCGFTWDGDREIQEAHAG